MKKDKHSKHCQDKQKHISSLVLHVGVMLGRDTLVVLANLSQLMEGKMDEPILQVHGWINGWIQLKSQCHTHK